MKSRAAASGAVRQGGETHQSNHLTGAADGLCVVASRFSCLASLSSDYSFVPQWHPRFVSQICPEDRCHLNGLAMQDRKPRWVTALGESNEVGGWRQNKANGGVLIDVSSGESVVRGLSMPHSPRAADGKLYLLNSGAGELCVVDTARGTHEVIATLPGYLRGLAIVGSTALVGLSKIRERHIFGGLTVQQRFRSLLCGIATVDISSGRLLGLFEFTAAVHELYDVQFLPGIRQATILAPDAEGARQGFTAPEFSYWLRPSSLVEDRSNLNDNA